MTPKTLWRGLTFLALALAGAACSQEPSPRNPLEAPTKPQLSGQAAKASYRLDTLERHRVSVDKWPAGSRGAGECRRDQLAERLPTQEDVDRRYNTRPDGVLDTGLMFEDLDRATCSMTVLVVRRPGVNVVKSRTIKAGDVDPNADSLARDPQIGPDGSQSMVVPIPRNDDEETETSATSGIARLTPVSYVRNASTGHRGFRSPRRATVARVRNAKFAAATAMNPLDIFSCNTLAHGAGGSRYSAWAIEQIRSTWTTGYAPPSGKLLMNQIIQPFLARYHNPAQFGGSCIVIDSLKVTYYNYLDGIEGSYYLSSGSDPDSAGSAPTNNWYSSDGALAPWYYSPNFTVFCAGDCGVSMRVGAFRKFWRQCYGFNPTWMQTGHQLYKFGVHGTSAFSDWSHIQHLYSESWNGYIDDGSYGYPNGHSGDEVSPAIINSGLPTNSCYNDLEIRDGDLYWEVF